MRILGGERASGIETPLQFGKPLYDGRELKHWRIQDTGSSRGKFNSLRPKSAWEQYRWQIAAGGVSMLPNLPDFRSAYEGGRRLNAENISRQQIAELARMNRLSTAGELTASIAHDLRQPLSAILINSEAAELILKSDTPDLVELKAIVDDIKRDDRRANDVITQLRGFLMRAPSKPRMSI